MKRPSFQFYPSDWLRDTALRTCSTGARGLWMDMICYMHEGTPYGHLKVGDKVILPENLARMVGETIDVVEGWLSELKQAGVYDLTDEGVICSRRMIRDESIRNSRASGGKLGGNPSLVGKKVNLKDKQKPTPSSSSSSSSSSSKEDISVEPQSVSPPAIEIPILGDKVFGVSERMVQEWSKAYPAVNVMLELGKMRAWALSNPSKKKTAGGIMRFINAWLSKAQDQGGSPAAVGFKNQGERNADVLQGLTRGLVGGGNDVKLLGN